MKEYICLIWSYGMDRTYMRSQTNESLEEFKKRVNNCWPEITVHKDYFEATPIH